MLVCVCFTPSYVALYAQGMPEHCPRPAEGSVVAEPEDLHGQNGVLKVELTVENSRQSDGSTRYCYIAQNGQESPNLRVNPGDLVILTLKNELTDFGPDSTSTSPNHMHAPPEKKETRAPAV
jgi:hypothetical protein